MLVLFFADLGTRSLRIPSLGLCHVEAASCPVDLVLISHHLVRLPHVKL
jgi:hypothetical protein